MIRFAKNSDIDSIISLWNEAFFDSEENIRVFIDNRFVPQNTLVYEENGTVVSMLFLLEGNLVIKGKSYPSYYLYAACTAESCRGRGIMAMLLEKAKEITAQRNRYFICLKPAEESLFDYYGKYGYKTIFSSKIIYVDSSELEGVSIPEESSSLTDYADLRQNAFMPFDRFDWDNSAIEFACKHNKLYSGKSFISRKGYALYNDDVCIDITEFAYHPSVFKETVRMLLSETAMSKCIINLPADYPTDIGKSEESDSAMALPVKPEYGKYIEGIKNAYLGLTLD